MQCSVTFVIFVLFWATTVDSGVKSQSSFVHPSVQVCLELTIFIFWGLRTLTSYLLRRTVGGFNPKVHCLVLFESLPKTNSYVVCCCFVSLQLGAASFYLFYMLCFVKTIRILIQVSFQYKSKPIFYEETKDYKLSCLS